MKKILLALLVMQFTFLLSGCCPCALKDKPQEEPPANQESQIEE